MSQSATQIRHLLKRSQKAQDKRDCAGAYRALIQAVKAFGFAMGAGSLEPGDDLTGDLIDRIDEVFDGCIGD